MADRYGSYYDDPGYDVFRAAIRYEITSKTDTQYVIRCRSWVQMGDGHDNGANIQGRAYITNEYSNWVTASGYLDAGDESGWLGDITKTITRTHSDQTITCSGQGWARSWGGSDGAYTPWVNATVTVPAKPSYAVKYNANGGSGAPSAQTKWYGESLTLRSGTPTRTGYSFRGWATTSTGSVKYAAGDTYTANAAVTLYAVWQALTYSVSYNANGGSGTTASQTKNYNQALTLRTNGFTRTNYVFKEWNTKANGTGTSYQAGGTLPAGVNQSLTLYAIWYAPHTVSYDGNAPAGATVSNVPSSQTKVHGVSLTLSTKSPACVGYDFLGWATSSGGSVAYQPGGPYASDSDDVTLYAIWRASSPTVTVSEYYRSDDQGVPDDEGGYVTVSGSWAIPESASVTIAATLYERSDASHSTPLATDSDTASGTSGDFSFTLGLSGGQQLDPDTSYEIIVTGTNDGTSASSSSSVTLSTSYYPVDVLNRAVGKGVAIGKPASTPDLFDVGLPTSIDGSLSAGSVLSDGAVSASNGQAMLGGDSSFVYIRDGSHDSLLRIQKSSGQMYRHDGTEWVPLFWLSRISRTANTVLAAPSGSDGAGTFRALVAADLPTVTRAKGGTGVTARQSSTVTMNNECTATTNWCHHNGVVATVTLGTLKVGSAVSTGSTLNVGTIPSGYRPPVNYAYAQVSCTTADYAWGLFVSISTGGTMTLYNRCGKTLPTSASLYVTATYSI